MEYEPARCSGSKKDQQYSRLHEAGHQQQVKGEDASPLLSTGEATSEVLGPGLGSQGKRYRDSLEGCQ